MRFHRVFFFPQNKFFEGSAKGTKKKAKEKATKGKKKEKKWGKKRKKKRQGKAKKLQKTERPKEKKGRHSYFYAIYICI